eukprot:g2635.t1
MDEYWLRSPSLAPLTSGEDDYVDSQNNPLSNAQGLQLGHAEQSNGASGSSLTSLSGGSLRRTTATMNGENSTQVNGTINLLRSNSSSSVAPMTSGGRLARREKDSLEVWLTSQKKSGRHHLAAIYQLASDLKRRKVRGSYASAKKTAVLLRNFVGGSKWETPAILVKRIKQVGRILSEAQPMELTIQNIVHRVLFIVRDAAREYRNAKQLQEQSENTNHQIQQQNQQGLKKNNKNVETSSLQDRKNNSRASDNNIISIQPLRGGSLQIQTSSITSHRSFSGGSTAGTTTSIFGSLDGGGRQPVTSPRPCTTPPSQLELNPTLSGLLHTHDVSHHDNDNKTSSSLSSKGRGEGEIFSMTNVANGLKTDKSLASGAKEEKYSYGDVADTTVSARPVSYLRASDGWLLTIKTTK